MRIRVFDLETATDVSGSPVCEIGWCDVASTNRDLLGRPDLWRVGHPHSLLVNPGCRIEPGASAIHHIVDEDVASAPTWPNAWRVASTFPEGEAIDALAAHSAKFERAIITDELTGGLPWLCTYKCALRLWQDEPRHSNMALRYSRRPVGLVREIAMPAHRAGPDAYVTAHHLRDQLELAPVEDLIKWSSEPALQVICHIGKQRGNRWREVDTGFLYWLLDKDFDDDVLFTARTEIERREKEAEAERDSLRQPEFGATKI